MWNVGFEALTAVVINVAISWHKALCSLYVNRLFNSRTNYTVFYPRKWKLYTCGCFTNIYQNIPVLVTIRQAVMRDPELTPPNTPEGKLFRTKATQVSMTEMSGHAQNISAITQK
jgi:hypothetical protein